MVGRPHGDRRTVGQAPYPCSGNPSFTGLDLYPFYVNSLLACRRRRAVNARQSSRAGPQRLAVLATLHPTPGEPSWGVAPGWTRALALRHRRASHRPCSIVASYVSRRTQILHIPKTPDGKSLDIRISAVKSGGHGRLGSSSGALGAGESELTYNIRHRMIVIQQKIAGIKHLK